MNLYAWSQQLGTPMWMPDMQAFLFEGLVVSQESVVEDGWATAWWRAAMNEWRYDRGL